MEVISLASPVPDTAAYTTPRVLVLGFFDGVHRGHQAVIAKGRAIADQHGWPLSVLTFADHPAVIYRGADRATFEYLSPITEKTALMARFGVDQLFVIHTDTSFRQVTSQQFIDRYVVGLDAQIVVAGFDYTFGPRDVANMQTIDQFAQGRFQAVAVPPVAFNDIKVGSTEIRELLIAGKVDQANDLLGWTYCNTGTVVHGLQRGRELGYPTANLAVTPNEVVPGIGIYATRFFVRGQWYPSMTSIGHNVTFEPNQPLTVESNLLDFNGDIYGEPAKIVWDHYLRGEVKFSSAQGLIDQLAQDAAHTRQYYAERTQP
ncbi:riboflavin biosynthesis protein RibF [Schleiferilactobacillus harbinensis]|jgi:riboflavin kinase/FMN adenylyltransferase|uniref:riboflavin biosynthesis protein RibF n=1 Tax=Schleiferilactobacillus harbinensis TaxID=304207 RepID=UPI00242D9E4B|nr:riboflavin biosynthesis protein RibF [Schleiferilactobacillus harbinensis]MCI1688285.1 riboflavin biosynthesis protein RibF [Schleiferilactobacillus harbinensis]MCI1782253.1 riboflavin biosynthesis protein RibF [Schleiferilactobacillus harbinensis]MCI1850120.1 riboflavin biosynthesis protein RibF [Schleiferilactobacillus harbinensis]